MIEKAAKGGWQAGEKKDNDYDINSREDGLNGLSTSDFWTVNDEYA